MKYPDLSTKIMNAEWKMPKQRFTKKERAIAATKLRLHDARNCLKMSRNPHKVAFWNGQVQKYALELEQLEGVAEEEATATPSETPELTGSRVNYYLAYVESPQREEQDAYMAECEDIIQALGMTFDEGCIFKALWRTAAARQGNGKPGQKGVYDAEKMVHYAGRILSKAKHEEQ
ncbi:hypothetical protein HWB09_gp069 [Pectobacterium phage vB_PatP_CB4]|uniref:3'-phosphatase, 5'-polynucleotide kinase n=1 Tax=Pectobacterium phage vB_PatP_CB4 TaxID=1958919 RepID=A0A2P9J4Z4_9CAUD|nr:hypothetical protein HWB09_gp069 [Pectobacterium phage vB_PatP_CB4]AQT27911.1 hypothetical protein CB4_69 [Pectobacterium phage vB_PatP_CB4]